MTDASRSYARSIRRFAEASARAGAPVVLTINPASAIYLAHLIERGCRRSDYVRTVQAEAERLRDEAEDELLKAQDLNAAADRALARAERYRRRILAGVVPVAVGVIGGLILAVVP